MSVGANKSLEFIRTRLEPLLTAHYALAEKVVIRRAAAPEEGSSSETYLLDIAISRNGDTRAEKLVLRIQASDFQVYQDASVDRQYAVLEALSRCSDAPTPNVVLLETNDQTLGAPFFLMECIDGRAPPNAYHSEGVLSEATSADRESMWLSAIEKLARLHKTPATELPFLDRPSLGPTGLDQEIAAWDEYLIWSGIPTHPHIERTRKWLDDHMPEKKPTSLAWGDARLSNVMFRDNRCRAFLDWETVSLGGAETDLGWWLYYDHSVAEGAGIPRLDGLGGRKETIAAWEHFSGRKAEAMEWHEVFATWRFALISERAIMLTEAAGGKLPIGPGDHNPAVCRLGELIA